MKFKDIQLARLRLYSQLLVDSSFSRIEDTVRHMLALQAQNFSSAQWAIGVRTPGSTAKSVIEALNTGKVIRSWPMRGTLHFVTPYDLRWMLSVTTPRTLPSQATRHSQLELDDKTFKRARKVAEKTLEGNRRATREDMLRAFETHGINTDGQRGIHLIQYLAHTGVLCWGPIQKTKQTLVLLDEWAPLSPSLDRDQALSEFAKRYFVSHGPATIKDFAQWTKLTLTDARRGLNVIRNQLVEVLSENDTSYWMSPDFYDAQTDSLTIKTSVLALPAFDEHLLGYQDRSLTLPLEYANHIVPYKNGMFQATIVHGGIVVGTWQRISKNIQTTTFNSFSARMRSGFNKSIERYGEFLGMKLSIT